MRCYRLSLVVLAASFWRLCAHNASDVLSISEFPSHWDHHRVKNATRVWHMPTYGDLGDSHKIYAAYATVDKTVNANIHFVLWEGDDASFPVVVYLMGGPGVPGLAGWGVMQNMPLSVSPTEARIVDTPSAWSRSLTAHAHVIWLDAPVHVGYSFADATFYTNRTLANEPGMPRTELDGHLDYASQVRRALQDILERYNLDKKPLHLVGISYGGKYAPAVAWDILKSGHKRLRRSLASVTTFGGWMAPEVQLSGQVGYFVTNGLLAAADAPALAETEAEIMALVRQGRYVEADIMSIRLKSELLMKTGVTILDTTTPADKIVQMNRRLKDLANMPSFRQAFHVAPLAGLWTVHHNSGGVAEAMMAEVMKSYAWLLPKLMRRRRLQMNFVVGQLDGNVRAVNVEEMVNIAAEQAGKPMEHWKHAERKVWRPQGFSGQVEGSVRESDKGNLRFYVLLGEGMLPGLQKPDTAAALMRELLHKKPVDYSARLEYGIDEGDEDDDDGDDGEYHFVFA
eukprot:TRINITY_DN13266_c0_g2_i1.p1 TRINITY_DN13266_c0_g2~~TRINITY_DN13266_c0_g2_i1.p1  ORF type:complete len:529 (+),score=107.69 TRINITY_DN13266_c0_g2_i1:53-1588(+)